MFSPTLHSLFYQLLVCYFTCICYIIIVYCCYSTELLALCDGCLGWGWVSLAQFVSGLHCLQFIVYAASMDTGILYAIACVLCTV